MEKSNNDSDLKLRITELEGIVENLNKKNSRLSKEVELLDKDYHSMLDHVCRKIKGMNLLMEAAEGMEKFMTSFHADEACLKSYLQARRESSKTGEQIYEEAKARTKLVDSSYELLEALKWIIEDFEDPFDQPESIHSAKLLISKFNL